jgi:hypothetical protein
MSRSYYIQMMKQKDERITELEKERDQILKSALDSESNYCELKDSLPAHNLKQQAKGLTDYAKTQEQGIDTVWMISAASKLLKQSEALKEGK